MAAAEIMGSRRESEDGKIMKGVGLWVSEDGAHGLTVGTSFFTPAGGSVESGTTGRRLVSVSSDPEWLPGLVMHVAQYMGPKAYA